MNKKQDIKEFDNWQFHGHDEPIGTIIKIHPSNTARARLASHFFNTQMFVYFGELNSGQTGWGVSYIDWLKMKGWKSIGFRTFERVISIDELDK